MNTGNLLAQFDEALRSRHGARYLVGVDEVGRGPLAGPVVAAAVLLPDNPLPELDAVRDSKKLSPQRRESCFKEIRRLALGVGVGWSSASEIDSVNILNATFRAMRRALERVDLSRDGLLVVVDGNLAIPGISSRQETIVSGDALSLSIACASVVAKVVRDRWMRVLDRAHPGYGLEKNKGYGTADHMAAMERLGMSPQHRRSFRPSRLEGVLL